MCSVPGAGGRGEEAVEGRPGRRLRGPAAHVLGARPDYVAMVRVYVIVVDYMIV